jgi:hypothetical protein
MLLNSSSMFNLYTLKASSGSEIMVGGAVGVAGALAGVAAIVLGILAVAGGQSLALNLVALLVLGAAILVTGNGMNNAAINMFKRSVRPT